MTRELALERYVCEGQLTIFDIYTESELTYDHQTVIRIRREEQHETFHSTTKLRT